MKIWTFWHKIPSDNPPISLRICQNRFSAGKGLLEVHQPVRGGEGGQPRELLPAEGLCSPNISLSSISTRPRGHRGIGDIDIRLHGLQKGGSHLWGDPAQQHLGQGVAGAELQEEEVGLSKGEGERE